MKKCHEGQRGQFPTGTSISIKFLLLFVLYQLIIDKFVKNYEVSLYNGLKSRK